MLAFFAVTTVTKFSSDGSFLHNLLQKCSYSRTNARRQSTIFLDQLDNQACWQCLPGNSFHERIKGHHTEVFIAPGAHRNGASCHLFVACDKDKGQAFALNAPGFYT
jgi:hypothetical protein